MRVIVRQANSAVVALGTALDLTFGEYVRSTYIFQDSSQWEVIETGWDETRECFNPLG